MVPKRSVAQKTVLVLNDGLKQRFFNSYHPINRLKHLKSTGLRRKIVDALDSDIHMFVFEFTRILIPKCRHDATLLQLIEKLAEAISDRKIQELSTDIGASVAELRKQLVLEHSKNVKELI